MKVPLQRGLEPDKLDLGCSHLLAETGELTLFESPQVLTIPGKTLCLVQRLPPESLQSKGDFEVLLRRSIILACYLTAPMILSERERSLTAGTEAW